MIKHESIETNSGLLIILTLIVISIGGLVEIVPLFYINDTVEEVAGVRPYTPLELRGRDIYQREGCYLCHSQMIRPFRDELLRYGHYSLAAESKYDHPFQWGSKRTGPDLARVGGRYSDDWHRAHLINPRDVVPESNMPGYPWLETNKLDGKLTAKKMSVMNMLAGKNLEKYTDQEIADAGDAVKGRTEMDAMIAYLQVLGTAIKQTR